MNLALWYCFNHWRGRNWNVVNVISVHNLTGWDTIRRYGSFGVGITFLKEVFHCVDQLWGFLCSRYNPVSQLTSCYLQDVGLLTISQAPYICLHAAMLYTMKIVDWPPENVSKSPQSSVFLIRTVMVKVSSHSNRNPKTWLLFVVELPGVLLTWYYYISPIF